MIAPEKTTVTKKVRRIAEWDPKLFEQSCLLNAPTEIALTFADYVDPHVYDSSDADMVMGSVALNRFLDNNLAGYQTKLRYIGTGPHSVVEVPRG